MVHHKTLKCIQLLCCFIIFLFLLFHCCWPEQSKQDGQAHAERPVWPHRRIGTTSLKNQWSKANARKWLQLKLQCEQVGQVPSESLVTRCHKYFSLLCLKLLRGWYALVATLVFLSLSFTAVKMTVCICMLFFRTPFLPLPFESWPGIRCLELENPFLNMLLGNSWTQWARQDQQASHQKSEDLYN